jgi:hypothetical protein
MVEVFGKHLRKIKSTAKSAAILKWKQHPSTKSCYKKIFDETDFPGNPSYMELILKKVWSSTSKPPEQHVAWAISIVQTILNPKNGQIKITEDCIKNLLSINIVSICNFTFKNFENLLKTQYKNKKK